MRITQREERHIDFNTDYSNPNNSPAQIESVFYKFMGYLIFWVMASGIVLGKYHLSDHSTTAIYCTLAALVGVTLLSFSAAFWTLCANWLSIEHVRSHKR